ncbi:hypothetical protein [Paenibacillus contaminans]|uniref:Uncharacterized protein n=1 Tax=Paenibacillus contaminans TaxID=450362 RepID=A0A329MG15_9BACL|nr:hypothetical protein [Paenibacillus contaminans]RAV18814.1 hypothetical protein DQG23_24095 [Paenibacillus contaminans]
MKYYICHRGKRLTEAMTKEQAIKEIFLLSGAISGLSILIVEENTGKIVGEIKRKKKRRPFSEF